jgi:hypothetical protein
MPGSASMSMSEPSSEPSGLTKTEHIVRDFDQLPNRCSSCTDKK